MRRKIIPREFTDLQKYGPRYSYSKLFEEEMQKIKDHMRYILPLKVESGYRTAAEIELRAYEANLRYQQALYQIQPHYVRINNLEA